MHGKPNVLHIIDSFHQGGSERQAVQLVHRLHAGGRYRVHLACLDGRGVLRDEVDSVVLAGLSEFRLTSFYDLNAIRQLHRCARLLRAREIDVVHTHDFYTNVFGMAAAAVARVPVRIASRRETTGMHTAAQKCVERGAYRLAHAVVANAEAVREQLIIEGMHQEKICVIHNGLDLGRIAPAQIIRREETLAALGLPDPQAVAGRRLVTIVANLRHPVKDYPMFLRAAQRVRATVPDAGFIIAGEGELLEQMRALTAELGLERDVFFIGRCSQVAELLSVSELCVLSSKSEGFSNSILEYMAAARPVVVTDVGGARETVIHGETGYLVPSGDDAAMAARIVDLLSNSARAGRMGERGRRVAEERFSCEVQLDRTVDLYERLLARSAPAAARRRPSEAGRRVEVSR